MTVDIDALVASGAIRFFNEDGITDVYGDISEAPLSAVNDFEIDSVSTIDLSLSE